MLGQQVRCFCEYIWRNYALIKLREKVDQLPVVLGPESLQYPVFSYQILSCLAYDKKDEQAGVNA